MKCKYCNSQISLEDEICPFCGAENELKNQHQKNMEQYTKLYGKAKEKLSQNIRQQSKIHKIHWLAGFLILMNLLVFALQFSPVNARHLIKSVRNKFGNPQQNKMITDYLEKKDYRLAGRYYNINYVLDGITTSGDWQWAAHCANWYDKLQFHFSYLINPDVDSYMSEEESLYEASMALFEFFYCKKNEIDSQSIDGEYSHNLQIINDMEENIKVELKTYYSVTEEEYAALTEMDQSSVLMFLGRIVGIHE